LLSNGDHVRARNLLELSGEVQPERDPRHWEWHHLNRLGSNYLWHTSFMDRPESEFTWGHAIAISPDAKWLAISGGNPYERPGFDDHAKASLYLVDSRTGAIAGVWKHYQPEAAQQMVWRDANTIVTSTLTRGIFVIHVPDGTMVRHWGFTPEHQDMPGFCR